MRPSRPIRGRPGRRRLIVRPRSEGDAGGARALPAEGGGEVLPAVGPGRLPPTPSSSTATLTSPRPPRHDHLASTTTAALPAHCPALAARVAGTHRCEVPAWITLPVTGGSDGYLKWVVEESATQ
ncbi:divalent cation tolerance protein CutA [Streptomyces sp. NPDC046557]|uniref:divalent cation tolerance protein CutA n=1 Tax=Streptomyces sp. NPDC046557 TaxID=3155372 RepID=UPI0033E39006